jgi:hypothetical protein
MVIQNVYNCSGGASRSNIQPIEFTQFQFK